MIILAQQSRQPQRVAWTREQLLQEHAIALGHAIDPSTAHTYNSHLQSYLSFCKLHHFSIEPTPDMLIFYVVFMGHHIDPRSVSSYLSSICNTLEPYYLSVQSICNGVLVMCTLAGVKKLQGGSEPL